MDQHDFEKAIKDQAFREIPGEWKHGLLAKARAVSPVSPRPAADTLTLSDYLRRLLWPCPQAWAGLAATWLVLLLANFGLSHTAPAAPSAVSSPVAGRSYKEQEKLLVELLGEAPGSGLKNARFQTIPSPQSSRYENLFRA